MRKREVFKKQEAVCWKNKGGAGKVGFPGFMVENGRAMEEKRGFGGKWWFLLKTGVFVGFYSRNREK